MKTVNQSDNVLYHYLDSLRQELALLHAERNLLDVDAIADEIEDIANRALDLAEELRGLG